MGKLTIDQLETGMIVAEDVRDRSGRLLIGSGAELSDKTLRVLKTWGVVEVEVEGADGPQADVTLESLDAHTLEELKAGVLKRFKHCEMSQPFVETLYALVLSHEATKLGGSEE